MLRGRDEGDAVIYFLSSFLSDVSQFFAGNALNY